MDSPHRQLLTIPSSGDPSNHVLAGDIMSPETNELMISAITRFVLERNR
jgi:hypothetical protein